MANVPPWRSLLLYEILCVMGFLQYCRLLWSGYLKRTLPWARDQIGWAVLMLILPIIAVYLIHSVEIDWPVVRTTLCLYAGAFIIYALFHLIRAPWKIQRQQDDMHQQKCTNYDQAIAAKDGEIATYKAQLEAKKKVQLDVRVSEVFIIPDTGVAECFVKASIHNLTEAQPVTIPEYKICLTIAGKKYYRNRPESDLNKFRRVHFDEELEPFPHLVTVSTKSLVSLKEQISDAFPVKTGHPKEGWLHFTVSGVPHWPVRADVYGAHYELDFEGGEILVEDKEYTMETHNVESVEFGVRDPFDCWHSATKEKPLHKWDRGITRVSAEKHI